MCLFFFLVQYYLHRCPGIEAVKSFAEACKVLIAEGKIKYYGLSEVRSLHCCC